MRLNAPSEDPPSAYIKIQNLPSSVSPSELSVIFSQFGEITDIYLPKSSRNSNGYFQKTAFVAFEDARSAMIAVENMREASVFNAKILVDFVKKFSLPIEFSRKAYSTTGPDGRGYGKERRLTSDEEKFIKKQKAAVEEGRKVPGVSDKIKSHSTEELKRKIKEKVAGEGSEGVERIFEEAEQRLMGPNLRELQLRLQQVEKLKKELKHKIEKRN